ncbi:hypothetical protein DCAR_0624545 [Daucus carota subsp. sativus]|uniref:Uncharacterized protein n=1 Tax=Daucus carota subsp. sativus TaxID=79200 RepID=A0A164VWJ5_DAUCS|nr:hypothetical protein DCAR_0624545 [Daucus carota subsp. sativus]
MQLAKHSLTREARLIAILTTLSGLGSNYVLSNSNWDKLLYPKNKLLRVFFIVI